MTTAPSAAPPVNADRGSPEPAIDGIRQRREGTSLVVTLVNPERRNAFTPEMRRRIVTLLDESFADDAIRAVVLCGEGGHFCAGADISSVGSEPMSPLQLAERVKDAQRLVRRIALGPKPVIAAVEGVAFGGGLSIAAACDFVVAAEDAKFGVAFTSIGLMPDLGLLHTLGQRIGRQNARRMIYFSERMTGREAADVGLVDEIAAPGEALGRALELAERLASAAPLAIAATKRALAGRIESIDDALALENDLMPALTQSSDFREGISAFREKRRPRFTGR